ncbi:leucine-rich repeat protein [Flammeovirga kamogawensis]|uniref:T9SS type A sorting domain-containing protein n=1 Tax=Flammeovirga kamogawensis TaxID=373891 RepID=A0ABX8H106_9BACT|nr:leucine-rich repeat protein [Flammeovirga kamogawensis]MBB6462302.1 hypothetical protein [Flammeovirga kamogawensis]QWG09308.1 T9SS type A sorting domain-containing protein [Flammeovirga kamogawensis]TRX64830.1 T9SS type A sorting domain-containing protein [Flammeovirga kamogawensis]
MKTILLILILVFSVNTSFCQTLLSKKDVVFNKGKIISYHGTANNISIPASFGSEKIISIGTAAFKNKNLEGVDFTQASHLSIIEEEAFRGNKFTHLSFKGTTSLIIIESHAFADNKVNMTVDFKGAKSLFDLGSYGFENSKITAINFNGLNRLRYISDYTFSGNEIAKLNFIGLDFLQKIHQGAFTNNKVKMDLVIDGVPKLNEIAIGAFKNSNVKSINFVSVQQLTNVDGFAFAYNKNIESVSFNCDLNADIFNESSFEESNIQLVKPFLKKDKGILLNKKGEIQVGFLDNFDIKKKHLIFGTNTGNLKLKNLYITNKQGVNKKYLIDIKQSLILPHGDCINVFLPIELSSFEVTKNGNTNKIEWVTSQEINNSHFIIERSLDQHYWEKINEVNGSGNSNVLNKYSTHDFDFVTNASKIYYRLTQVDFDGKMQSWVKEVKNNIVPTISIYPNPVVRSIHIQHEQLENNYDYRLMNSLGEVIRFQVQLNNQNEDEIDLSLLPKGIYFLQVMCGKKVIVKKRIIKSSF